MFDVLKTLTSLIDYNNQASKKVVKKILKKPESESVSKSSPVSIPAPVNIPQIDTKEIEAQIRLAQTKAREIILEAKDESYRILKDAEIDIKQRQEKINRIQGSLDERDKDLYQKEHNVDAALKKAEELKNEYLKKLEKTASLTRDEAREVILNDLKMKLREEMAKIIREAQTEAHEEAEVKAREILVDAMRHGATDYVAEYSVSVVKIPDEDVKGRIIGKEGRNIRAFETATGVDVDLDEEGVIRLSCFDPVRREIARVTLERLLRDGRVQPGRIEDLIVQVKKEIDRIMFEEGQKLCHAVGVYNLPAPLVAILGKFKYRFSYGQNMIAHTLEETKIGIALAREIGADVNIVRLGCLLHDIGKVVMDKEGTHIELGVELLKKYGIPQKVIDCVAQHHEDTPFTSIESVLVYISDAISGSRPGARYENYDEYIKRLRDLEDIAKSQQGVTEAFAFQAGRELRVVVTPDKVDDATVTIIARGIKNEIEEKLTYPGQVKVTVVRELRVSEVAK